MSPLILIVIIGIMFLASSFRTAFGFGEALVAVPLLALMMPIKVAAPVAVLASITVAAVVLLQDWRHIHFGGAKRLIISTLFGLPLGLVLLKYVPEPVVKISLAGIIMIFSGYSLLNMKSFSLKDDRFAWVFGLLAGITGGSYGLNGPPLAIYGSLRKWPPERFRATLQSYFLPASLCGMCGYAVTGIWTLQVTEYFLWSAPAIAAGIFTGRLINRKMSAKNFDRLLPFFLILIALVLLFQGLEQTGL